MARPKLATVLVSVALFVFFLVLLFPYQNLRGYIFGRIYRETHVTITAEELYPVFLGWPGLGMKNADVTIPPTLTGLGGMGSDLDLSCKKLVVRIGLAHLFPPTPSFSLTLNGLKKGGDLYLKFSQTSKEFDTSFDADGIELSQLMAPDMADALHGKLSGSGYASFDTGDPAKSTGDTELKLDAFGLGAQNLMGVVLAPIHIGPVDAKFDIKAGSLEIKNFKLGGTPKSDLSGSLSGDVRLGRSAMQDFINLTLKIQLSEPFQKNPQTETLRSFLSGYQTTPGNYAMKWSATLYEMTTNTFKALPQKVTSP